MKRAPILAVVSMIAAAVLAACTETGDATSNGTTGSLQHSARTRQPAVHTSQNALDATSTEGTTGKKPGPSDAAPRHPHDVTLTGRQLRAVIHARHPYLHRHCFGPVGADSSALTTTVAGRRVLIATADCRNGTTGSPTDIALYAAVSGHLQQLYLLDSGSPLQRGRLSVTERYVTVRGATAVVHYGGLAPGHPLCCASRSYHRVFRLRWRGADAGPLVKDHNIRVLGPP